MTAQFFDVMVDIETAGTRADAAMLSIGAVFFDTHAETLGPQFSQNIHLSTSVREGGTMDPATIIWWLGQSDEARKVRFNARDIREVMNDFRIWLQLTCRPQELRPWGNSASFDLGIVGSALDRLRMDRPWRFGNERCFRTVRNMYPQVEYDFESKGDAAHNALADAEFQANHLFKIKRALARHKAAA